MAPPHEPPTSITLRVKVPPGHVPGGADEFTLGTDIAVGSKIGQIRERIQEAIPSSPTPERQRLLYGGRALVDNDQTVADALNIRRDPTQTEYVIHLLVKGDGASTAPVPHRTGMGTPARSVSPAAAAAARPATVPPAPAPQPTPNALPQHAPGIAPQHLHQNLQNRLYLEQVQHQQQQMHQHLTALAAQAQAQAQAQRHQPHMLQHHGFPPQLPFQMPAMPLLPNGLPIPTPLAEQVATRANGIQNMNEAPQTGQQPAAQSQDGLPNSQPNNGQPNTQIPPRFGTHQGHAQIRIQQTLHMPHPPLQAQQRPGAPHTPGTPSPLGNAGGPSALDRARENIADMRRMLDEIRNSDTLTDAQQARIRSLEERTLSINEYIDPFRVGNSGNNRATTNLPTRHIQMHPNMNLPSSNPLDARPSWQQGAHQIRQAQQLASNTSDTSSDVTCYLLSSPTGPQALLYSAQHGIYTGHMPPNAALNPTPTSTHTTSNAAPANGQDQANQPVVQGQGGQQVQAQAQAQAQAAQQDPLGPLGPIMGHLWLLLRVLIFSYFLLGANMGWRRPLALFAIGMGFWMIRMGLLGDGGALRRWWDGIMNDGRAPPAQQQQGQPGQNQQQEGQQGQPAAGNARPGQMPTPEQLAQRLLDDDARAREQVRDQRLQWLRERIRPVERAVALLVASLWPGVGEAYVRAREQEERRRAEEEIAARRREEEERQKNEEEEKQKSEGTQSDEKSAVPAETEASTTDASNSTSHEATRDAKASSAT